ncbi:TPA: hypothetical protein N0F65_000004 [Lagenidium giganteum]|uniref:MtN3-like protein n=1 Tax=Lagenidium giganteum TaxID=4803 RepID=A0AAV2YMY0_9STRA|nr:TPA: hypothetical protein N0F65_000004 [Lagenidium giganteum]
MGTFLVVIKVLASLSALYMCFSPTPAIYRIHKTRSTGHVSIIPLVALWGCNHIWMLYGYVTDDLFPLLVTYAIGDVLCLIFVAVYFRWTTERKYVAKVCAFAFICNLLPTIYAVVGMQGYTYQPKHDVQQITGFIAIASSVILYASPFSAISHVIKTKSNESIPILMVIVGAANNTLWIVYGYLVSDLLLIIPTSFNAVLGVIQMTLYGFYHPKVRGSRIVNGSGGPRAVVSPKDLLPVSYTTGTREAPVAPAAVIPTLIELNKLAPPPSTEEASCAPTTATSPLPTIDVLEVLNCTMSATVVLVVKILASITALYMCFSPVPAMLRIYRQRCTGHMPILPLIAQWIYNHIWMLYGYTIQSYFPLLATYVVGTILSVIIIGIYYTCTKERSQVARLACGALCFNVAVALYTAVGPYFQSSHQVSTTVGAIAICSGFFLYASPLATIREVLHTKSALSIPLEMVLVGTLSNAIWTAYGFLVHDLIIIIPTVINTALCLFQLLLYVAYHPDRSNKLVVGTRIQQSVVDSNVVDITIVPLETPKYGEMVSPAASTSAYVAMAV